MSRGWQKAITVLVVLTVMYVFISPVFDLDPSANRAWRAALQVMLSLALVYFTLAFNAPMTCLEWFSELAPSRGSPDLSKFSSVSIC